MVFTAEPGAVIVGVRPPSSRGPREEKGNMAYFLATAEP